MRISIYNVDERLTKKNDPYLLVETNDGKMSVFDAVLFDDIKNAIGKEVTAEIVTSGNYKNIVSFGDVLGEAKASTQHTSQEKSFGRNPETIVMTDCYKLATDLCVAGKITMEQMDAKATDLFTKINNKEA